MEEVAAFDEGMRAAFDPKDSAAEADKERITGITSWWHSQWCTTCGHTFRRGDIVRVDRRSGEVGHLEPGLGCLGGDAERQDPGELREFLAGIDSTWPVAGSVPVVLTDDELYLLAAPIGGLQRRVCLYCAHSLRPHELVVVCPCNPRSRECRYAVHRDPGLGLVCWESWRPSGNLAVCPVTQRRLAP